MAIATTMEQQALECKQVERWFVSHGVPHLMRNYSGRDRIPTLLCWLFLVVAFEVGAAPWLHMSAWRLLAAPLVLLIPAIAIAPRTISLLTTSRTRHVLWSLPVALYALWLAATITRPGGVPNAWSSMWIDFPLVYGVLLTSAVLFRVETWQFNPSPQAERRRRTLIALIVGGVVVFSLEGSLVPGFHEPLNAAFSGVLPDDARLSQGVPALPLVGAILALAVRVTRDAWIDERPALDERTVAALVPAMPMLVLVLGIETTVLPHASKNEWVQATPLVPIALLLALAAVLWRHRTAVPLTTNRPGGRLHVTYQAIGAWLTLYLLTYPVLVLLYSEIDVYQHGLQGITGFAIALGVNLLYLGLTWFIVTFGLDRIAAWAFREAWRERGSVCEALFRGLPLLVLFATFFMFGAELWEAVVKAGTAEFLALLGVLLALTAAFMFTTSVREIHRRCHFASWGELACAIRGTDKPPRANDTPIVLMLQRIERNADPRPADPTLRLRGRQWINAMGVLTVYQALIFVPVLLGATAIFYVIADLLVPLEVAANWVYGDNAGNSAEQRIADSAFLERPWARTAIVLAFFSLLYTAVTVLSDASLRSSLFRGADEGISQRFAAGIAYRLAYYPDGDCEQPTLPERLRARLQRQNGGRNTTAPGGPPGSDTPAPPDCGDLVFLIDGR